MTTSAIRILAISGAQILMEDMCVIVTKDIDFKDRPPALTSTNAQIQTEAVLTHATTRLVLSPALVQAVWIWNLREAAKTKMNVHILMEAVSIHVSTHINPSTASVGKDTFLKRTKRLVTLYPALP